MRIPIGCTADISNLEQSKQNCVRGGGGGQMWMALSGESIAYERGVDDDNDQTSRAGQCLWTIGSG